MLKKKTSTTPVPIHPVSQLPQVLSVMAYGRSGTGKTTFASTFPKPILLLDVREKGTDSVSNVPQLDVGEINDWEAFEAMYWYLAQEKHKYKTVVVDQITQLQDLAIVKAMKDDGKDPKESISKRNWGQGAGLMKTWLLNYRDLIDNGMHVVFLAHDRMTSGEDDSGEDQIDPSVGARLMPSVASFVNGMVKIIGNTFIRETYTIENKRKIKSVEYAMRIGAHAYFTAKARSPVGFTVPASIVNPSFDHLVSVMQGTYNETKPAIRKVIKHGKEAR